MTASSNLVPFPVPELRNRIGVRKRELPLVLPLSSREIDELAATGNFPKGFRLNPNGHLKFDMHELQEWWERVKLVGRTA